MSEVIRAFFDGITSSMENEPMIALCVRATLLICGVLLIWSVLNKKRVYGSNSSLINRIPVVDCAQLAITVGVTFTFIGIIYSLLKFDVSNTSNISASIQTFLSGMKTAFITSIIGIVVSVVIKIIQAVAENKALGDAQQKRTDEQQKITGDLNSIAANIEIIAQHSTATAAVTAAIQGLKDSIDRSSSGALERVISNLSEKMDQYIVTSQDTRRAIQDVADKLMSQTQAIDSLGMSLQRSGNEQVSAIHELGETLKNSGQSQIDAINALGAKLQESSDGQSAAIATLGTTLHASGTEQLNAINRLGTTLTETLEQSGAAQLDAIANLGHTISETLEESGRKQVDRLDSMNAMIAAMNDYSKKTYENSVTTLEEARTYQQDSLKMSQEQLKILSDNTNRITEMKDAFERFLDDMARKNNEEFIKALNESMKDLNQRLTEQFGENFKELNRAVFKVVEWQENYKDIIASTTEELTEINDTFKKFTTDVAPVVAENAERLQKSIDNFTATSEKNVEIQTNLTATAEKLNLAIIQTHTAAENLTTIHDALIAQQQKILQSLETSFEQHQQKMTDTLEKSTDDMAELLKQHTSTVKEQMHAASATLAGIVAEMKGCSASLTDSFKRHTDATVETMRQSADRFDEVVAQNQKAVTEQLQATAATLAGIVAEVNTYSEAVKSHQDAILRSIEDSFRRHTENLRDALQESTNSFSDIVQQNQDAAKQSIDDTAKMFSELIEKHQTETLLQLDDLSDALREITSKNQRLVDEALEKLNASITAMQGAILGLSMDTSDKVHKFDEKVEEVLEKISFALDGFNTDFQGEIVKAMTNLQTNLETLVSKNSDIIRDQNEQIAVALGTITKKMAEVYESLAKRVDEIDKEIMARRNA